MPAGLSTVEPAGSTPAKAPRPWHALEAAAAIASLGSDAGLGLSSHEVARRLAEHGPNELPEPPRRSVILLLLRHFQSPLIYILFVAAALAAGMRHWGDAAVILAVVVTNTLIGAYQEGRAERSMAALRRLSALQVRVLRELSSFGWFVWRQASGTPYEQVRTETFTVLAACQWFNVMNCQSSTRSALQFGIARNPWLLAGLLLSVILQAAVLYWPPLGTLLHTVPIAPGDLLPIVAVASAVLWAEELRKWRTRLRRGRQPGGNGGRGAQHPAAPRAAHYIWSACRWRAPAFTSTSQ